MLLRLRTQLQAGQATALSQPQAISGLGGIGKTQIAVEYAYQHRQDYQAILWTRADTQEALVSGYVEIAQHLNLPQKDEQDQTLVVKAVLHWFKTQRQWLLILDNADDLKVVREFLPPTSGGHILLTTRAQAVGRLASRLEVETMDPDMGALLLLRRATLIAPDALLEVALPSDVAFAQEISRELGGLPLALDQAGAYLEETGCGLADYQHLYQRRSADLLAERRGLVDDHPLPVAATWSLSFARVEERNGAAADLLCLCSFLAPDAIPETIVTEGAKHLGPQLASVGADPYLLNQAIEALRAYSLVRREASSDRGPLLSVHRLVQAVLKDQMDEQSRQQWAERAVRAVNEAFPWVEYPTWLQCDRLLPHALVCATWIEQQQLTVPAATRLLIQAGIYLKERARYAEAELLYQRALAIDEQQVGSQHPDTAASLANLAELYRVQGKYEQAEPLHLRALAIHEQQVGPEHPDVATDLNNLALLYADQGKYEQAEPLHQRALAIREQQLGPQHPDTVGSHNNLALLYADQGKYEQAEPLLVRALAIHEQQVGPQHPYMAASLGNLAALYYAQGKYEQAEPLFQRALAIHEKALGSEHPNTASSLSYLAALYYAQGKYEQAEPLFQRALAIHEKALGSEHPNMAASMGNLAELYRVQGKYEQAEPLHQRALAIYEKALGSEHPDVANNLNNLALLYRVQGKYEQAEPLHQRALAIREQQLGPEHPYTAASLGNLAALYYAQGKYEQAEPLHQRALAIYEKALGPEHPYTAASLGNLALLYHVQGKYEQAEPLHQRALAIYEKALGPEHPDVALDLNNLAALYYAQGKYEQAEPLYQRALAIYEQLLGAQHPKTQRARENYASLLRATGRDAEAASLEGKRTPPSSHPQ